jgi:DNA-binding response OmpR family regulator
VVLPDERGAQMRSGSWRVLVVDDDPLSLEIICEYLQPPAFETVTAHDGQEGWSVLDRRPHQFDVVLTDRMMPRIDGMQLLQRIKRDPRSRSLPVIMVTAAAERRDIVEGINAGAYYYLTKPIDGEMLVVMAGAAASDYERFRALQREVRAEQGVLGLLRQGIFEYRRPEEATRLGAFLAKACPQPERVVTGLSELLINAVEHGNLEISYAEKSTLIRSGEWQNEVERRLTSETYAPRVARVELERTNREIVVTIRDQGAGFDPKPYLQIDPQRVFDSHGRGIAIANLLSFDSLYYRDDGREAIGIIQLPD